MAAQTKTADSCQTGNDQRLKALIKNFGNNLEVPTRKMPLAQGNKTAPLQHGLLSELNASTATPYRVKGMEDLPDPLASAGQYWLKGLISPGDLSVWYGPPGSGKSFLLLHVAYCISLGMPVLGRRIRKTPVLYITLEAATGFERRLAGMKAAHGDSSGFRWMTQPVDLYGNMGNVEGVIEAARRFGAGIIIVDTLARAFGSGSENESGDMGQILAAVDQIRDKTGAHLALVHHCGKNDDRGPRGHSSLMAAADLVIEIKRNAPGPRTARVAKSKDGEDGEELAFDLKVQELGQDEDGDPVTTCIVIPSSEQAGVRKHKLTGQSKTAFDLLVRVVNEQGMAAPPGVHLPADRHVVPVSLWRQYCDQGMGGERDKPDSRRKAFNRAFTHLKNLGHVGSWGDFVWVLAVGT